MAPAGEREGEASSRARPPSDESGSEPSRAPDRSKPLPPGLYVVATPIGNLRDITLRALDVLDRADLVACEDTRVTGRLLTHFGIAARLVSYNDHNAERARPAIIERLTEGGIVALCSDAGTPLVNDPGYKLVREAAAAGAAVYAAPGASAPLAALAVAGLPTDRFLYAGFLSAKSGQRRQQLAELAAVPASLVFLESPKRLAAALADMADVLGTREAAVARELTKLHEEVRRAPLAELAQTYADMPPPKGEVTLVVGPPAAAGPADDAEVDRRLADALAAGSLRDAAERVAVDTGRAKRDVYNRALALKQAAGDDT